MRMGEPHEGCQGVIFDLKFKIKYFGLKELFTRKWKIAENVLAFRPSNNEWVPSEWVHTAAKNLTITHMT